MELQQAREHILMLDRLKWRRETIRSLTASDNRTSAMYFGRVILSAMLLLLFDTTTAGAEQTIIFGLNWVPQGEMCGFFQAQARGFYKKAGLNVELKPGNPNLNLPQIVAAGAVDMAMGSSFTTLNMVQHGIRGVTLAAMFQKDPQTLVVHAGQGVKTLDDLKGRPIMVGQFSRSEFWQFLKARYNFTDDQLRPYAYSSVPFLANPQAVQQGYITEDALLLGKQLPEPPVSLLLADYGYDNYATTIYAMDTYVSAHPEAVQAFVNATKQGYEECIKGDYAPAMAETLRLNPEGGEELFRFKLKEMRERGIVESGDAEAQGIGTMTDARWTRFFETMAKAGVFPPGMDYKAAYTLRFIGGK